MITVNMQGALSVLGKKTPKTTQSAYEVISEEICSDSSVSFAYVNQQHNSNIMYKQAARSVQYLKASVDH